MKEGVSFHGDSGQGKVHMPREKPPIVPARVTAPAHVQAPKGDDAFPCRKSTSYEGGSVAAVHDAKMGLPRAHRDVLETDEDQVIQANAVLADAPFALSRVFEVTTLHVLQGRKRLPFVESAESLPR